MGAAILAPSENEPTLMPVPAESEPIFAQLGSICKLPTDKSSGSGCWLAPKTPETPASRGLDMLMPEFVVVSGSDSGARRINGKEDS
mmetsp:Transcript_435/g.844  ORF Transcript_435/g.844 Transcript_435/m.844 type:complete len:87 (-) Transcript_435:248-508(-)|eukprot:CAMPEP_0115138254 /NCGR_PEP_ID=MMETSP0227-20121206/57545_1 /TAXON_ID=89957 /ORGANISM="Polarella glacialis, Strain CCMP 1383" /LENGTH=86 /DNA_ID=CAMNT_0002545815 /DNA_START=365 /DNA_END=625 /DNA_ORIENTATION=-